MIATLGFKAQALDNVSPDHYHLNGKLLGKNTNREGWITREISEIAINGTYLLKDADGVEIIQHNGYVLMQCYSEQRDAAGRSAPVLCFGAITLGEDPQWVIDEIVDFAKKIGRTVDQSQLQRIATKLKENPRKSFLRNLFRTASLKTRIG